MGQEYLVANGISESFECEAEAGVNFTYKVNYDLGDIVTVKKKSWNMAKNLRITEICKVYEYGGMYVVPTENQFCCWYDTNNVIEVKNDRVVIGFDSTVTSAINDANLVVT